MLRYHAQLPLPRATQHCQGAGPLFRHPSRSLLLAVFGQLAAGPASHRSQLCNPQEASLLLQVPLELQARLAQLVWGAQVSQASPGMSLADAWTRLAGCLDESCRQNRDPADPATSIMRALLGISIDEVPAPALLGRACCPPCLAEDHCMVGCWLSGCHHLQPQPHLFISPVSSSVCGVLLVRRGTASPEYKQCHLGSCACTGRLSALLCQASSLCLPLSQSLIRAPWQRDQRRRSKGNMQIARVLSKGQQARTRMQWCFHTAGRLFAGPRICFSRAAPG